MKRRRQDDDVEPFFVKRIHIEEVSYKRKNHFDDCNAVKRQRTTDHEDLRKRNFELQEHNQKLIMVLNNLAHENEKLKYLLSCQINGNQVTYNDAIKAC